MISLFLVLTITIIVYASNPYSAEVVNVDAGLFPLVTLDVSINDHSGLNSVFTGSSISLMEKGEPVHGPMVVLPPGTYNNKIDLAILLDKTGTTKNYEQIIKSNISALITAMTENGVDLTINLVSFDSGDTPYDFALKTYPINEVNRLIDDINGLEFGGGRSERIYGFEKIQSLLLQSYRPGSEKIALIVNGSQYLDSTRGESTVYSALDITKQFSTKNFTTFVIGFPLKQMIAHSTDKSDDVSLSHSLPGGYLGSFSSDLTRIYHLLKERKPALYTVSYFSNLSSSNVSSSSVDLRVYGDLVDSFSYPSVDTAQPEVFHEPLVALLGEPYTVKAYIYNRDKYIDALEMTYWMSGGIKQSVIMEHRWSEDKDDFLVYEGSVNPDFIIEGDLFYYLILHLPHQVIDLYSDIYTTPVLEYDAGIKLIPQLVNGKEVLWRWEGSTVDLGKKYQLVAGDEILTETTDRHFTVPIGDCNFYQIVKLRVLVKDGTDHPYAGGWSLFSLPFEYYAGPEGTVTESEGVETMFNCLKNKSSRSISAFIASQDDYQADGALYLAKTLDYTTVLIDPSLKSDMRRSRYSLLYYFMHFINTKEMRTYKEITDFIPVSILYKVITNANQSKDFKVSFTDSKAAVADWIFGDTSF